MNAFDNVQEPMDLQALKDFDEEMQTSPIRTIEKDGESVAWNFRLGCRVDAANPYNPSFGSIHGSK